MAFDINRLPPGGWVYREETIQWTVPDPMLPFNMVVDQIRKARANNPGSGLGSSWQVCSSALMTATTARMVQMYPGDRRWSGDDDGNPPPVRQRRCASCRK